jgi:hypothetical protein
MSSTKNAQIAAERASQAACLNQIIAAAQAQLSLLGVEFTVTDATKTIKTTKTKKTGDEKPKEKGVGGAHAAWSAKMAAEFKSVKEAFTAERVAAAEAGTLVYTAEDSAVKQGKHSVGEAFTVAGAKQGIHLVWAAQQKKLRRAEYDAFAAEWKEAHPKGSAEGSVADDESVAESEGSAKKRGPKKLVDMTADEFAVHKAKTAQRKALKAAKKADEDEVATHQLKLVPKVAEFVPKPVAAKAPEPVPEVEVEAEDEDEDEDDDEAPTHLLFTLDTIKYFRLGTKDAAGKITWHSGDLWSWKKGVVGDYYGLFDEDGDGSIDTDADAPMLV